MLRILSDRSPLTLQPSDLFITESGTLAAVTGRNKRQGTYTFTAPNGATVTVYDGMLGGNVTILRPLPKFAPFLPAGTICRYTRDGERA